MVKHKKGIVAGITVILISMLITAVVFMVVGRKKTDNDFSVPNYYSLEQYHYDGDFNAFYEDSYNWYRSIENEEGVYIINTCYNSDELLQIWREEQVYKNVPGKAFWEFTVSPSYLKQININIEEENLNDAIRGVRVYLVPDSMSDDEYEVMCAYLEEAAIYAAEQSLIKTEFIENKEVKILRYTPMGSYFTWASEKGLPITDDAPVLYVCTSENMKYFESESLIATGIDSYIKFSNEEIMKNLTKDNQLEQYKLTFAPSSEIYKKAARYDLVDSGIDKVFQ
ncbi:MAG: hypothetical protein NC225_01225 [Clostridium sp.]|nr:hypothetical protein [Clostridium sp.]MCM1398083.1 hypothetical protein [Clostridium sp.]MCM1459282.1 hypothetical protein [Bacteroides sp.]